jgi:hypothetical protein
MFCQDGRPDSYESAYEAHRIGKIVSLADSKYSVLAQMICSIVCAMYISHDFAQMGVGCGIT